MKKLNVWRTPQTSVSFETLLIGFIYYNYCYLSHLPLASTETICMTFRWVSRRLSASRQWCVLSWRSRFAGRLQPRCINAKETLPVTFSPIWSPSLYQQVHTICRSITSHTRSLYITQHHKLYSSPPPKRWFLLLLFVLVWKWHWLLLKLL